MPTVSSDTVPLFFSSGCHSGFSSGSESEALPKLLQTSGYWDPTN